MNAEQLIKAFSRSVFPFQMAKKQEEEDRLKALIEKRTEFIEKTKGILSLPDIVESKSKGGRKGRVINC